MKLIEKGIFKNKGLYQFNNGYISPEIPADFKFKKYDQDKQCTCYRDGNRTEACIIHDYMCAQAKTIKERFIADLVLAYNVMHTEGFLNRAFHWWFMSIGTIPYGFFTTPFKK